MQNAPSASCFFSRRHRRRLATPGRLAVARRLQRITYYVVYNIISDFIH